MDVTRSLNLLNVWILRTKKGNHLKAIILDANGDAFFLFRNYISWLQIKASKNIFNHYGAQLHKNLTIIRRHNQSSIKKLKGIVTLTRTACRSQDTAKEKKKELQIKMIYKLSCCFYASIKQKHVLPLKFF